MDWLIVALRLIHIVFGVFWAGAIFFVVSFILPTARKAGPAGGGFMRTFAQSGFVNALAGSGTLTVLSGWWMMWIVSGNMNPAWMGSPTGIVLSVGGLAATAGLAVGLTISRPAGIRMGQLAGEIEAGGGQPNEAQAAELPALQARMAMGARWVSYLVAIAVVCMAVARYVG